MTRRLFLLLLLAAVLCASTARALTITGQLSGDRRAGQAGDFFVDVTITVDEQNAPWLAHWVVKPHAPSHPEARLDALYFNLSDPAGKFAPGRYSFSNLSPEDWAVFTPASVQGAGGATFAFEVRDADPGGEKKHGRWVTKESPLHFDLLLSSGTFEPADFRLAAFAYARDGGSGQLGAHLRSLSSARGESDSGFVFGTYTGEQVAVPEPGSLGLVGGGLLVLLRSLARRARG